MSKYPEKLVCAVLSAVACVCFLAAAARAKKGSRWLLGIVGICELISSIGFWSGYHHRNPSN